MNAQILCRKQQKSVVALTEILKCKTQIALIIPQIMAYRVIFSI